MSTLFNGCSRYTLVVVDMQPGFKASLDADTLMGVLDEIRAAMAARMPIIVLQTMVDVYGNTLDAVMNLVRTYDDKLWVVQDKIRRYKRDFSGSDGSYEVMEAVEVLEFPGDHFRLCGVNSDVCVFLTAMVLNKELPDARIEIVKRACNTQWVEKAKQWESWAGYERWHDWHGATLLD
jgi:hypothetical protein